MIDSQMKPEPKETANPAASAPATRQGRRSAPEAARVGALRGAGVQVDARAVVRAVVGVALVAVTVVAVVLIVAGIQKNSQIRSLQNNGVPVEATVTGCLGQLGGSGSNAAGYSCTVTYTVAGHGYQADLPGSGPVAAGSTVHGVVASNDPALFATPAALAGEQASARVYVAPAAMLFAVAAVCLLLVVRRRRRPASAHDGSD